MFDILVYLFEVYMNNKFDVNFDKDKLNNIGFDIKDVCNAINLLERLISYQDKLSIPKLLTNDLRSMRIYTEIEKQYLNSECRGLLLFLEQIQVLNLEARETIIEIVIALNDYDLNLEDLKYLILMVLFNMPGHENIYQQIKRLLFQLNKDKLH